MGGIERLEIENPERLWAPITNYVLVDNGQMREEPEEKVSSRRLENDLLHFERNFVSHEKYWESLTIHSRIYLSFLLTIHAITFYRLCKGFYYHNIDLTYILPALSTSALIAWFIHAGRCDHLQGLDQYRATRTRALARLSLTFNNEKLIRTPDWSTETSKAAIENIKITAMASVRHSQGDIARHRTGVDS